MESNLSKRESNRIKKNEMLINAAESIFMREGFVNTSIDVVAKEAGVTKRTLYQYFLSKEDLFFAVVLKSTSFLIKSFEEEKEKGKNVLEKIRLINNAYLKFYINHREKFRLLSYQPTNKKNIKISPYFQELNMLDKKRIKLYIDLVAESKLDKSINCNFNTEKAVYFAFFSSFSLLYTISSTVNLWEMLGFTENEFLDFSFDLLSDALK